MITAFAGDGSEVVPTLIELLRSADRDTRGLALQQVREGTPDRALTEALAAALPALAPENQSALLDALAERGDPAARPAVLKATQHSDPAVRAAAWKALGTIGQASDALLLITAAAASSEPEKSAARASLIGLRGPGVNAVLLQNLDAATTSVRAETFQVLARRGAHEAMPAVLRYATNSAEQVRSAALRAAAPLASPKDLPALMALLSVIANDNDRREIEAALLAVGRKEPAASLSALLAAEPRPDEVARLALLRWQGAMGGANAFTNLCKALEEKPAAIHEQALELLSEWPDPCAVPVLLQIARHTTLARERTLALRGLARLSAAEDRRPANPGPLIDAWPLAQTADDKRQLLGVLGATSSVDALEIAGQALAEQSLEDEAALACVQIAEKMARPQPAQAQAILRKIVAHTRDPVLRQRAESLLGRAREGTLPAR